MLTRTTRSSLIGIAATSLSYDVVGALYLCLLYVYSPIEKFRASDNRLTNMSYTPTVAPLLLAFSILPKWMTWMSYLVEAAQWTLQRLPILIGTAQFLLACSVVPNTQQFDRLWNVRRDVPWIRGTIGILVATVAVSRAYLLAATGREQGPEAILALLRNELAFAASVMYWLVLVKRDFKDAGMQIPGWSGSWSMTQWRRWYVWACVH